MAGANRKQGSVMARPDKDQGQILRLGLAHWVRQASLRITALNGCFRSISTAALALVTIAGAAQQPAAPSPAQEPPPGPPAQQRPKAPESQSQEPQAESAELAKDRMLANAAKLYYSTEMAGLEGFDCAVQPDWRGMLTNGPSSGPVAENDPRMALLRPIQVHLYAHMSGDANIDWRVPAVPPNDESAKLVESLHQATEETLMGFVRYWAPFVNGSVIPQTADGQQITSSGKGYRIHSDQGGTAFTEELDSGLVLRQFDVDMGGMTVHFTPTFKATEKGLLVDNFGALSTPQGQPSVKAQELHVGIEYKKVEGFPIPAKLAVQVVNAATFQYTFDGCRVTRTVN